jgi:hypothetical protein
VELPAPSVTNSRQSHSQGLDNGESRSKIPGNSGEKTALRSPSAASQDRYDFKVPASPQRADVKPPCKHPRVQIVSRDEDSEFVECKECGEIFESSEFKDMSIEERTRESDI